MSTAEQLTETFIKLMLGVLAALVLGTIVWITWEPVVVYFFSYLVRHGVPADPSWWKCVLLVWFVRSFTATNKVKHTKK